MFYRKGEGLTFNVLIIALIGLVVFIVVIVIFSQNTGKSVNTIESCASRGGDCKKATCDSGELTIPNVKCDNNNPCCKKLFGD